jgi:hypothetical protein
MSRNKLFAPELPLALFGRVLIAGAFVLKPNVVRFGLKPFRKRGAALPPALLASRVEVDHAWSFTESFTHTAVLE